MAANVIIIIIVHHNTRKTKREVFVFVVMKPRPLIEPLRLERTLDHSGLPEFTLGKSKSLRLVSLIADRGRTATRAHIERPDAESAPAVNCHVTRVRGYAGITRTWVRSITAHAQHSAATLQG